MFKENINDYYFDLENIFKFVFSKDDSEINEIEITDGYDFTVDKENQNVSKVVRELKNNANGQRETFKYDMVKYLIDKLFIYDEGTSTNASEYACFNTLLKYNFLKTIKDGE